MTNVEVFEGDNNDDPVEEDKKIRVEAMKIKNKKTKKKKAKIINRVRTKMANMKARKARIRPRIQSLDMSGWTKLSGSQKTSCFWYLMI